MWGNVAHHGYSKTSVIQGFLTHLLFCLSYSIWALDACCPLAKGWALFFHEETKGGCEEEQSQSPAFLVQGNFRQGGKHGMEVQHLSF